MLTEKQKAERLQGLGGSDIAAALGVSPWKTQLELWGEKTGLAPDEFEGNEATYWGSAMELLLSDRFLDEHSEYRIGLPAAKPHKEHDCLRANVDGIIFDKSGSLGIWEAKTGMYEFTEVPVHYQLQVQHYMCVYDLPFAIISVLFHGNTYKEFRIERDASYETDVVPQLLEFWSAVESKLPIFKPTKVSDVKILMDVEGRTVSATKTVVPDSGYDRVLDDLAVNMVRESDANGEIAKLKAILMADMSEEGVKTLTRYGKSAATIVIVADSLAFDAAKFKSEQPEMHGCYMNKTRKGYVSLRVTK